MNTVMKKIKNKIKIIKESVFIMAKRIEITVGADGNYSIDAMD